MNKSVCRLVVIIIHVILGFKATQSTCPANCLDNTDCDAEPDGGCPQCTEAYYGRQCQYRLECYMGGIGTYRGLLNTTQNGYTCQAWNVNTPHFFDNPILKAGEGNYCRKDTEADDRPWCYTTNPGIRYDFCRIPRFEQQCKAPPQFPELSLINPAEPGIGFYDGYTALFVCPDNATVKSVCRSNTWSNVSCSDICTWNLNGKEQTALQLGEKANISCPKGYHVNSTCLRDNTFSESPYCKIISCGEPDFLTNFHDVIKINGSYNYQDILNISCIRGYESNTTTNYSLLICNENKTWTGDKPFSCCVIKCNTPVLQNKSFVISPKSEYVFGDAIHIDCEDGYELVGNTILNCLANKSWSGSSPNCEAIVCSTSVIENQKGRLIVQKKEKYFYNDTIQVVCQDSMKCFNATFQSFHQCRNKEWSGWLVDCEAKDSVKCETCQFQPSSFGAGLATGVGSTIAVFTITFVIWYLAVRRKPDCLVSQTNASFANNHRIPNEDNAITKENEHIYLELNSTRIQPNTTYCNTDVL